MDEWIIVISDQIIQESIQESLITILCEIECILNSRPLLPCSNNPNYFKALTPNNFLIKRFDNHSPGIFDTSPHEYRSKWKSVQRAVNLFWERFMREYIPSLQWRQKWLTNHWNFQENNLVLIKDDHLPRSHWPLGRVTKVFQGKDSIIRSVEIKLPNSKVLQSSAKLCLLERSM